ncbi:hypothetical protein FRACA_80076 [Frankia canadensis]|uniref:Uncharacterized protein n=1 Tax=Frankia canadensis TaxID=1836972 RepID=A0A2I2L1G9_9ACTN|nr:hypothetical protein FRACA_80076 [Frankia canadensis]SOU59066.1 hypothetical protein FRACA_80076 [Frankia canadensis]
MTCGRQQAWSQTGSAPSDSPRLSPVRHSSGPVAAFGIALHKKDSRTIPERPVSHFHRQLLSLQGGYTQ